jgi:outer membrane protein TolC
MKRRLLAATTLVVAGCAHYTEQPLSSETSAVALQSRTLGAGMWTRTRLVAAALQMQPELEVARAKVATAQAAMITAGARPNPSVGFSATNISRLLGGASPWTTGFTLDIPLETAGKRGHRVAQAQALANAAALNLSHAEWQAKARVRKSLSDLFAAKQRQDLLAKQQTDQEEIVKLLDARIVAGEISRVEAMQARLQLSQSRLLARDAEKLHGEARVGLAEALGVSVHALDPVQLSFAGIDTLPRRVEEARLRRGALLQRSDLLAALAEYAAAEAAVRGEIAKQYPDLHLGPGYSYDQGQNKWTLGFNVTIPLLDQNRGPIAEALAKRRESAANFNALQAKALGELERALVSYRGALAKLETADQLLAAREKQQRSSEALFKGGESDRLALISAQLELHAARLSRLDAQLQALQSLGQLEDAAQLTLTSE